jgi:hypothetical protein
MRSRLFASLRPGRRGRVVGPDRDAAAALVVPETPRPGADRMCEAMFIFPALVVVCYM